MLIDRIPGKQAYSTENCEQYPQVYGIWQHSDMIPQLHISLSKCIYVYVILPKRLPNNNIFD